MDASDDSDARRHSAVWWLVTWNVVLLVASGVYLAYEYQPKPPAGFEPLGDSPGRPALADIAQNVHRWTAILAIAFALVGVVVVVGRAAQISIGRTFLALLGWLVGVGALVAGFVSGGRLAWSEIGLWAGGSNSQVKGVVSLPSSVRFVIFGDHEIAMSAFSRRVAVHCFVLPAIVAVAFVFVAAVIQSTTRAKRRGSRAR